jgi:hypothetical protein
MAVLLTVSETINGAAFNDDLEGPDGVGIDMGSCINGQYAPIISQPANTGHKNVFIRHDATIDPITDLKTFLQQYGVGTGFTYGGADSAANDLTTILNMGNSSASTGPNNADGLAGGLHVDMDWQVSTANQFDPARIGSQVRIYGDNGGAAAGEGRSLATAITMHADAMVYNNAGTEVDATTPVAGSIGKSGDTVLGDRAHPRFRFFLRSDEVDGGFLQWEIVLAYSYTAGLIAGFAYAFSKLLMTLPVGMGIL